MRSCSTEPEVEGRSKGILIISWIFFSKVLTMIKEHWELKERLRRQQDGSLDAKEWCIMEKERCKLPLSSKEGPFCCIIVVHTWIYTLVLLHVVYSPYYLLASCICARILYKIKGAGKFLLFLQPQKQRYAILLLKYIKYNLHYYLLSIWIAVMVGSKLA